MNLPVKISAKVTIPFLLPLLALLTAFPPLSTDMYLPAIPFLKNLWSVKAETINLTLVYFFLSYSLALLVYGPLSDRYGRKKPLYIGLTLFIFGSLFSSFSNSVYFLIGGRILQAIGAAGPSALALSITKDFYDSSESQRILALIAIIVSFATMAGPSLGSLVLTFASWQMIFVIQALIAIVAFMGVLKIPETNLKPKKISFSKMAGLYLTFFKNREFLMLTILFAVSLFPFFAFLVTSAEIYIEGFKQSEQVFGLLFAFNAISMMLGSMLCLRLSKKFKDITIIRFGFAGILINGLLLIFLPHDNFWYFTLPMGFISFSFGMTRPLSINMIIEKVDENVGAASSMIMFFNFTFAAIAMWLISLGGDYKIFLLGIMASLSGAIVLFSMNFLMNKK